MIRSMFSAISGLRNHQTMMDVVGNNISNVNTTGFKSSTTVFQDVLSQVLRGGGAANQELGGTNPAQVGLGSRVAAITTNFGQGALQRTGRATDLAVQGDGFFVVNQAGQELYTRAGSFSIDALGRLVTQEGAFVMGWQSDAAGNVNSNGAIGQIQVPVGDLVAPVASTEIALGGNLPSNAAVGASIVNSVEVFDTQGNPISIRHTFTKTAADTWTVASEYTLADGTTGAAGADSTIVFDGAGEIDAGASTINPLNTIPAPAGTIDLFLGDPGGANRLTQYGELSTVAVLSQDGSAAGSLQSFSVSQEGLVVGSYSNGRTRAIGQIALASFANPEGLEKVGGSNYRSTMNSGLAQLGTAGAGGRGLLSSGTLEMSNVDLAQEFTNLIVAQRGFQANSRVVTTSDELLQEVVNLKR
ncbi:flagellar basal-body rod protein FlgF [Actinomarinicola tropica]|uniref:Flagellar hook protein FlgE n=1 Tax=Actinomarinicola tropica TaxID=2789776 RepID=A0A5Q2RCS0_9ACTN|nr:flagellar basal-body rod protein FlgF [Actinomarinicola tropica]QGG94648.1 flagellar basal-body rod protein FlgF [Actinomarinicola tropica]